MRQKALLSLAVAVVLGSAGTAGGQVARTAAVSTTFTATINSGKHDFKFTQGACTASGSDAHVCPLTLNDGAFEHLAGDVTADTHAGNSYSTGLIGTGTFTADCSVSGKATDGQALITQSNGVITSTVTFRLLVERNCAFRMQINDWKVTSGRPLSPDDASTMSTVIGTVAIDATTSMTPTGGTKVVVAHLDVTSATGWLNGQSGEGVQTKETTLPAQVGTSPAPTGTTPTTTTTKGPRLLAAAKPEVEFWRANLHKGATTAAIAGLPAVMPKQIDPGLHVVSAPHRSCTGFATSGGKKVTFGSATTNHAGVAVLAAKLRPRLAKGKWTISVVCGSANAHASLLVG